MSACPFTDTGREAKDSRTHLTSQVLGTACIPYSARWTPTAEVVAEWICDAHLSQWTTPVSRAARGAGTIQAKLLEAKRSGQQTVIGRQRRSSESVSHEDNGCVCVFLQWPWLGLVESGADDYLVVVAGLSLNQARRRIERRVFICASVWNSNNYLLPSVVVLSHTRKRTHARTQAHRYGLTSRRLVWPRQRRSIG